MVKMSHKWQRTASKKKCHITWNARDMRFSVIWKQCQTFSNSNFYSHKLSNANFCFLMPNKRWLFRTAVKMVKRCCIDEIVQHGFSGFSWYTVTCFNLHGLLSLERLCCAFNTCTHTYTQQLFPGGKITALSPVHSFFLFLCHAGSIL